MEYQNYSHQFRRQRQKRRRRFITFVSLLVIASLVVFATTKLITTQPNSRIEQQPLVLPERDEAQDTPTENAEPPKEGALRAPQANLRPQWEMPLVEPIPASKKALPIAPQWETLTVKTGDSLAKLFQDAHLDTRVVFDLINLGEEAKKLRNIHPGDEITILRNRHDEIQELIYDLDKKKRLIITLDSSGEYRARTEAKPTKINAQYKTVTIDRSLFGSANEAGLPKKVAHQLNELFSWSIDFGRDLRQGDAFTVIYEEHTIDDEKVDDGDIIVARFINQGEEYTAIRYTDKNNKTDYFTAEGNSVRRAFLRYPTKFSHISSHFNPRRKHPVLQTIRPHRGVDLAAPMGTPIKAAGDGRIYYIGRKGGYGNTVILKHNGQYTTLYAHMIRFEKGLKKDDRVKQGQVIGYVGQTGMATGPHLHYEFHINDVAHNPVTVTLPQANPIAEAEKAKFLPHAKTLLALLDNPKNLPAPTQLAQRTP